MCLQQSVQIICKHVACCFGTVCIIWLLHKTSTVIRFGNTWTRTLTGTPHFGNSSASSHATRTWCVPRSTLTSVESTWSTSCLKLDQTCDAVLCCGRIPTCRRTLLPPLRSATTWSGSSKILRNIRILPRHYTVSQPWIPQPVSSPLWQTLRPRNKFLSVEHVYWRSCPHSSGFGTVTTQIWPNMTPTHEQF
jgi:hypothetical protein